MSLLHALVARGTTILAEHQAGQRDFSSAVQTVLPKIPSGDGKMTYVWEQYLFHYVSQDGIVYLVLADDSAGRRMPFAFLADMQRKFSELPSSSSSSSSSAPSYSLQGTFGPVLGTLIHTYNTSPPDDALSRAQAELSQVREIMVQNVEQILSRGERIELLVDKTDAMAGQANTFRRGARATRRQMWWKNTRVLVLCFFVAIVLMWIFAAQFCGAGLNQCGPAKKAEPK